VPEHLGDAIGRARVEWRGFALWRLHDATEHFGGRSLVEAGMRPRLPQRFEDAQHPHAIHVAGEERLAKGCRHEALRCEVEKSIWADCVDRRADV